MVDDLILIDETGTILMCNPAAERLFGYRAEELIGQHVSTLLPDAFDDGPDRYIADSMDAGQRKIIGIGRQVQGRRRDGSVFPMDLCVGAYRTHDRRIFFGLIHDVTARRKMEVRLEQAQKMEAMGLLSGGVAHDFNNLLTAVISNLDLLVEKLGSQPEEKALAELALNAALRGAGVTRQLLAYARSQKLEAQIIDLNKVIDDTMQFLRGTLGEHIDIDLRLAADLALATADPSRMSAALTNLAINARDAMPNGGKLTIETANVHIDAEHAHAGSEVEPGLYVMLAVSDTGVGMSPDILRRAFEPFFTTKKEGSGTGLGLSMVYGFARQSGGHVNIYSESGHGAVVRLCLPVATATGVSVVGK